MKFAVRIVSQHACTTVICHVGIINALSKPLNRLRINFGRRSFFCSLLCARTWFLDLPMYYLCRCTVNCLVAHSILFARFFPRISDAFTRKCVRWDSSNFACFPLFFPLPTESTAQYNSMHPKMHTTDVHPMITRFICFNFSAFCCCGNGDKKLFAFIERADRTSNTDVCINEFNWA